MMMTQTPAEQRAEHVRRYGIHEHYTGGEGAWRSVDNGRKKRRGRLMAICHDGTGRCFKLKLKNLRPEDTNAPVLDGGGHAGVC